MNIDFNNPAVTDFGNYILGLSTKRPDMSALDTALAGDNVTRFAVRTVDLDRLRGIMGRTLARHNLKVAPITTPATVPANPRTFAIGALPKRLERVANTLAKPATTEQSKPAANPRRALNLGKNREAFAASVKLPAPHKVTFPPRKGA